MDDMSTDSRPDTREAILQAARAAVQAHGYNALSFRELAKDVGVKSASVHYHFPTKGDLASALASQYADEATAFLDQLLSEGHEHGPLMAAYTALFRAALEQDNRMCLCGILAAETADLPQAVRVEVDRFTDVNTRWLLQVLTNRHPRWRPEAREDRALAIFAAIEGAQLVARGRRDVRAFDQIVAAYEAAGLFS
jgi:TetR/AcrR family transcriptional repressor of nem operon